MRIQIANAWRQFQALVNDAITMLPNLILGIFIFGLFYVVGSYIARMVRGLVGRNGHGRGVGLLIGRLVHYIVMIVGLLVSLSIIFPSFKAGDLIQVLGIGGVAVGFAFKDIFQNFLAGIIILVSRPFRIGDTIVVKNYEGTVEDIQTRATMVRTADNRMIVIPNTVLFTEEVTVITAYAKRRAQDEVGIGVNADLAKAKQIIVDALGNVPEVEKEPKPDVMVAGFGDFTTNLVVRWWTSSGNSIAAVRDKVLIAVNDALTAAKIEMPFPTRNVYLYDKTERKEPATTRWPEGEGPRAI